NGGLLIRMSQVQVLQGEPIKKSRIIDAAFLHLKTETYSYKSPRLPITNTSSNTETNSFNVF
ncbi:hypothetical protein ACED34_25700, partial [Vibrio splendidus]|uniref:hypothetical protein n=1 Tax=Vibrio splendidus TaxID=29497 RepID=UPI00352D8EBA